MTLMGNLVWLLTLFSPQNLAGFEPQGQLNVISDLLEKHLKHAGHKHINHGGCVVPISQVYHGQILCITIHCEWHGREKASLERADEPKTAAPIGVTALRYVSQTRRRSTTGEHYPELRPAATHEGDGKGGRGEGKPYAKRLQGRHSKFASVRVSEIQWKVTDIFAYILIFKWCCIHCISVNFHWISENLTDSKSTEFRRKLQLWEVELQSWENYFRKKKVSSKYFGVPEGGLEILLWQGSNSVDYLPLI